MNDRLPIDELKLLDILERHNGKRDERDLLTNFELSRPGTYTKAANKRAFAHALYGLECRKLIKYENGQVQTIESWELEKGLVTCECKCEYQSKVFPVCPECGKPPEEAD